MDIKELKEKDIVPRSLQDRYSILIIEQLIRLNENIEKLISSDSSSTSETKPTRKRGGKNDSKEA